MPTRKVSHWLNLLIKAVLFVALAALLYRQVLHNADLHHFLNEFREGISRKAWLMLSAVGMLTFVNWGIETIKWRLLILKLRPITWRKCVKGILFGITFSLFTPNRIGEFGGRVMAITQNRMPAFVSSLVGSFSQIVVNFTLGGLGLLAFLVIWQHQHIYVLAVFALLLLIIITVMHLAYYNLEVWSNLLQRIRMLRKISQYIDIVKRYSAKDLFRLQSLSAFRYLVYSTQYVLMLMIFGVKLNMIKTLVVVASIFFVQMALPTIALLDLGIRGNVAVFFLFPFTENALGIVAATFGLWLMNLIIPGIIGGIVAINFKFFKEG
jgi:hypothetical protein